ncbi:MAG TPA: RagB/SusD family nutrient uptake outer membrane protein [Gemmatimonadaceae bacterium]|mgnify:FL=1|nr:RagB/SusD family nutrient uptake outer membrane protein [Gemmatimonadaceae bacterium]
MMPMIKLIARDVSPRIRRTLLLGAGTVLLGGCTSILEVDNPNNVSAGALDVPTAASAIVNGAINTNANAMSSLLNAYNIISDETFQTGSRDDYRLLDTGGIEVNTNEYLQASYLVAMRARWMSEQAIAKVSKFKAEGTLLDQQLLVRAYMMGALIYDELANMFDDAAISDRTVAGKNLGEMGMVQLYDSALKWLDAGATIATGDNRADLLGLRARVKFDRAVWLKLNPPGTTPANPLINDAGANADAAAAIAAMAGDYRFDLLVDNSNSGDDASGGVGFEMNSRVEHTPDTAAFVTINLTNKKPTAITAKDPVTGQLDAAAVKQLGRFIFADDINHPPMTVVSKREMYLILAEAALAQGNNAAFDTNINALRALDGKVPYTGTGPTRLQLLQWERRVQLIFQGRRLNDMYRFGIKDPRWVSTSVAVRKPGCLLPIPLLEREANREITGTPVCQ